MPRLALLTLGGLLLAGCCSSAGSTKERACEANLERSRIAAAQGWENAQHDLATQPHPVLHVGMEASAAVEALGLPSHMEKGRSGRQRWVYAERELVVSVEDARVAGWER